MDDFAAVFVPFSSGSPAFVTVNGHRLLIVATEAEDITDELALLNAEELREITISEELEHTLSQLAETGQAGVVVVPPGASASDVIQSLHSELPWLQ